MHELSVALNIVEIAHEQVLAHNANSVDRIELDIGTLSGIEMDAFLFAWEEAVANSVLQKAERIIHQIDAKARCTNCELEYDVAELYQACPGCKEYLGEILQGQELKVKTLVLI